MRYRFEGCELDTDAVRLTVDGVDVAIQPQVADVLTVLIEERARVVSKEELLDRVWGHTFVTESALTSRIKSARQAIGDDGQAQRFIRTVHGRGYQFVGDVHQPEPSRTAHAERADSLQHRVPTFASRLIGRDADIGEIESLLETSRLVTIIGPGGVGKTRLAVAVAARSAIPSAFVDLTVVRDPALVLDRIAEELGLVHGTADPIDALVALVTDRPMLAVIDNLEHVIEAAPTIASLLRAAEPLVVIATSREPLRIDGEVVYDLQPLAVPRAGYGAAASVVLFEQTARAIDPTFQLADHRPSVERICTAVDGLPLAVELAASNVRTLPPEMLLPRLNERLRSSSVARRDAPDRQRTMAATIDWSLNLLELTDLRMFTMLGVLSSPSPLPLIEATVADEGIADPIDALGRLIDRSLLRRTIGADGSPRFGMLELLHERAGELLEACDDGGAVRDRHADAVARSLESLRERHWFDPRAPVPELVGELLPEARAAFAHATSTCQWEVAGRIIGALTAYRHREGGHDEARRWLVAVLPHLSPLTEPTRAAVLFDHGFNCWHHDEIDRARDAWEEAVARFEALDDRRWLAHALVCSAMAHNGLDDQGRRRGADLSRRGIELAREIGPPALVATVLIVAGEFSRTIDDYPSAVARYEEAAQIAETVGDRIVLSVAVANLSYVASHDGDYATARRLGGRGLQLALEAGRRQLAAWSVSELAEPALGLGEPELAARLIGAAERSLHVMGGRIYPGDVPAHERVIAGVVEALGGDGYDRCYADGAAMSFDESVELALRWASADLQAEPQR